MRDPSRRWWPNLPKQWERVAHVSQRAVKTTDPETGVVSIKWVGRTYVKPKEPIPVSPQDVLEAAQK